MSEPWDTPIRDLWPKATCPACHGWGATTPLRWAEGDYCDCIYDQLVAKHDFIRLADGDIEVHHAE